MSSGYKIKEHMESELSGIFQLKFVAKKWYLVPEGPILCVLG